MTFETTTLISIGTWLGGKLLDKGFDTIHHKVITKDFNNKFYKVVNIATKKLQSIHPDALGGNIENFFKHEVIFNELIKLLFINSKVNIEVIEEKFDIKTLPDNFILQFINILKEELYKDELFYEILSNKEIYLISLGVNKNIEDILKISTLSLEEIKNLNSILESRFKNNFSFSEFSSIYKTNLINNYSQLNFIGLGLDLSIKKGKRKKLEELFVKPTFFIDEVNLKILEKINPELESDSNITLNKIFNSEKNLVILGNPGSGKSILTKYICLKLIQKSSSIFENKSITGRIPFRIELRKYHAFKKDQNEGLIKYLRFLLEIEYNFPNITLEDIQYILQEKNTVLLFDGLDEIFDLNDKLLIKNDIENFIDNYKKSKSIITSRIIGYEDAALEESEILKLLINKFDDQQIDEYIKNWYLIEEEDEQIREKEINDFLIKKGLIDQELISNPLLLSLIIILYRNNLKVPESKLEIYQSCTKTLVDKWDHSKGMEINISEEIYKRKDTIFADLAYWQYKELSKKDGKVTYQRAKNTVAKSLTEKLKIADDFTSDLYSEQFLLYAQKRSLYFDNNFTHKTFLEYFTAFWIFSNIEKKHKKEERNNLIKEYIISPYWHIVLELLINLIDKDQADNEIIDDLIKYQLKDNQESSTFLLQIFNTIQNVSDSTFEEIVLKAMNSLLEKEIQERDSEINRNRQDTKFNLLVKHFRNDSTRKLIENCIVRIKSDKIKKYNENLILSLYLEIIHESEDFLDFNKNYNENDTIRNFSEKILLEDPKNYVMFEFIFNGSEFDKNPIPFAYNFLKLFNKKLFSTNLISNFSSFRYFPVQFICLKNVLFNSNYSLLNEYVELVEKHKISIEDLLKDCFSNIFIIFPENNFSNLMRNFNHLKNKNYLILLIPIIYKVRFQESYYRLNNPKPNLKVLIKKLNDLKFAEKLEFIINKKNNKTEIKSYIINNFKIDKSNFK